MTNDEVFAVSDLNLADGAANFIKKFGEKVLAEARRLREKEHSPRKARKGFQGRRGQARGAPSIKEGYPSAFTPEGRQACSDGRLARRSWRRMSYQGPKGHRSAYGPSGQMTYHGHSFGGLAPAAMRLGPSRGCMLMNNLQ